MRSPVRAKVNKERVSLQKTDKTRNQTNPAAEKARPKQGNHRRQASRSKGRASHRVRGTRDKGNKAKARVRAKVNRDRVLMAKVLPKVVSLHRTASRARVVRREKALAGRVNRRAVSHPHNRAELG